MTGAGPQKAIPPSLYSMRGRGTLARLNVDMLNEISTWLVIPHQGAPWQHLNSGLCRHCGELSDFDDAHHPMCYVRHEYVSTFPLFANSIAAFFDSFAPAMRFIDERCESIVRRTAELYMDPTARMPVRDRCGTAASIRARNYPSPRAIAEFEPHDRRVIVECEEAEREEFECYLADLIDSAGAALELVTPDAGPAPLTQLPPAP
jgi:hypothetical protein